MVGKILLGIMLVAILLGQLVLIGTVNANRDTITDKQDTAIQIADAIGKHLEADIHLLGKQNKLIFDSMLKGSGISSDATPTSTKIVFDL